jgi:hypothetical protein
MNDTVRTVNIKAQARVLSSKGDRRYPVKLSPRSLAALECACKGYEFSKKIPQRCKHMDEADAHIAALGLEIVA